MNAHAARLGTAALILLAVSFATVPVSAQDNLGSISGPDPYSELDTPVLEIDSDARSPTTDESPAFLNDGDFSEVVTVGEVAADEAGIENSIGMCSCDLQTHHGSSCAVCRHRSKSWIDDPDFLFGGWLQQGVTLNPDRPDNRLNAPVLFNDRANDYQLNQLYFYLGKEVCTDGENWDLGGRVDVTYGTDSRFVTVPGLEEHSDRTPRWNSESSDDGIALPQAYLDVGTPIGPYGSTLRVGHFYARGGYETFAAPDNFFYSHSYSYLYGQPFTLSGAMWLAKLNRTLSVSVAATSGWDSFYSDGDQWGVHFGLLKKYRDGRTTVALTTRAGKDSTGIYAADGPLDDSRVLANAVLKHYLRPDFYYVLEAEYGRQDDAVVILDTLNNTVGFDAGQWWSINQYLVYQFNDAWSAGLRVEWFLDDGNSRVSVPIDYVPGGPVFNGNDYFELTAGLNWQPHSNILLRPEIRWDNSDVESNPNVPGGIAGIRPYDDRSDGNQLTIATDLILNF